MQMPFKSMRQRPDCSKGDEIREFLDRMNRIYRMPAQTVPLRILFILSKFP